VEVQVQVEAEGGTEAEVVAEAATAVATAAGATIQAKDASEGLERERVVRKGDAAKEGREPESKAAEEG
jgi:hypothetical protein